MRHATTMLFVFCAILLLTVTGYAQLTITHTDALMAIRGKRWISWEDSTSRTMNLGTTGTGQSWDFSWINPVSTTARIDTQNYVPPASIPGGSNFPEATVGTFSRFSETDGGITFTYTTSEFIQIAQTGGYLLGAVIRVQMSPQIPPFPADTTYLIRSRPRSLGLPFPLTASGGTQTATDTLENPLGGTLEINNRTFTMAGSGTMTLPGGRQVEAIRLIGDVVSHETRGSATVRDRQRNVMFISKDFVQLEFDVDTNYTSGSTSLGDYRLTIPSGQATGVERTSDAVPSSFQLAQNYPNPFNPSTTITFDIPQEGEVSLKVYNMIGQEVATLASGRFQAGTYEATFDAAALPSGVYIYRLTAGSFVQTKSMVLVK